MSALPCPSLPIRVDLPDDSEVEPDLAALPSRPGVFVLEDESGRTLALAITADLRRRVRSRLARRDEGGPSRRVSYRGLARVARATTVGSAFEGDWACLQLARRRLPTTCGALLDRWRGWFIHVDPLARFPRFVKTGTPAPDRPGVTLGPFADKHAAHRAIEMLQDLFDLCRYHHILIEAPHANACAYKEMGKCPAPCDGTVGLDVYRDMMREAIAFATAGADAGRALERRMREASARLDFEEAARWRRRLQTMRGRRAAGLRLVDRIDRFRFLAVLPGERDDRVRLMLVVGGWIAPWLDIPADPAPRALAEIAAAVNARIERQVVDLTEPAVQNIGLVCWHLFRPAARRRGEFVPLREAITARAVATALRRLARSGAAEIGEHGVEEQAATERRSNGATKGGALE